MRQLLILGSLLTTTFSAFADTAPAAAAPAAGGFSFGTLLFPIILIAFFYFVMIRPQSKRSKEHRQLLSQLGEGDEVVTTAGMVGKVVSVDASYVELTIAPNVTVRFQKQAIATVLPKGTV